LTYQAALAEAAKTYCYLPREFYYMERQMQFLRPSIFDITDSLIIVQTLYTALYRVYFLFIAIKIDADKEGYQLR
jgi:hypothetical protein